MRISLKELSYMYTNSIDDDRRIPLGLRKEHQVLGNEWNGQSRVGARAEMTRFKASRS